MKTTIKIPIIGKISKENFIKWFIVIPLFLTGISVGIIFAHIFSKFSFPIPSFVSIGSVLVSIWMWVGIILYVTYYEDLNTTKDEIEFNEDYWFPKAKKN